MAVQNCQLVAQEGDLDILFVWFGTGADQPEDAPYNEEDDRGGHPGIQADAHRGCSEP